jgi:hypothetical protein
MKLCSNLPTKKREEPKNHCALRGTCYHLRRAWHAVRIHTNAPALATSASADVPLEHERTSLAVIENQGRMKLYNREQINALFARPPFDKGGWVFSKLIYYSRYLRNVRAMLDILNELPGSGLGRIFGFKDKINDSDD